MKSLRRRRRLIAVALIGLAAVSLVAWSRLWDPEPAGDGVFLVKPYLQAGPGSGSGSAGGLEVLWQGADQDERWSLEVKGAARPDESGTWRAVEPPSSRRIVLEGVAPRRLYRAAIPPGLVEVQDAFSYRVRRGGVSVFEAQAHVPGTAPRPHRVVVFGDGGAGTSEQRAIAHRAYQARPDLVMITGDVVYERGRFAEYLRRFFPVYNSDTASSWSGAPLLRSTLVLAAPGNHDLIGRDLDRCPDGLAYFLLWSLPLNGPIGTPGAANTPVLLGDPGRRKAFLDLAAPAYPRMANYSTDVGGVHWTVLDTNPYVDWTDPALRAWLARDLSSDAARSAAWRFVALHHPPFHSTKAHANDQRSRVLTGLFEEHGVDIVFCGHVHNYERTYPLRFAASSTAADASGRVGGRWSIDRDFDGDTRTRPDGIIYIVTGAGGAHLYGREQNDDAASWQSFTAKYVSNTHSLTVVDVAADRLALRQVAADGAVLDRFTVTRGEPRTASAASPGP